MRAFKTIVETIPYLKPTDTVDFALELMQEFKTEHLALVKDDNFIGLVSENQLFDLADGSIVLSEMQFPLSEIKVGTQVHVFDLLKIMSQNDFSIIPIVDEDKYIGSTNAARIIQLIAELSIIEDPGGIFSIKTNANDYSLSEISRVIESNNASILGVNISKLDDLNNILLTIKVSSLDLSHILASLERYEYEIVDIYHKTEQLDTLKDNYESLMKYLDI